MIAGECLTSKYNISGIVFIILQISMVKIKIICIDTFYNCTKKLFLFLSYTIEEVIYDKIIGYGY